MKTARTSAEAHPFHRPAALPGALDEDTRRVHSSLLSHKEPAGRAAMKRAITTSGLGRDRAWECRARLAEVGLLPHLPRRDPALAELPAQWSPELDDRTAVLVMVAEWKRRRRRERREGKA